MKASKFLEAQIVFVLKQAEDDTAFGEVCRKVGISEATFYNWRKRYAGPTLIPIAALPASSFRTASPERKPARSSSSTSTSRPVAPAHPAAAARRVK
jgi:transposase-like protein